MTGAPHNMRAILSMLAAYRLSLGVAVVGMLLDALLTVLRPWPLKIIIDRVIPETPKPIRVPLIGNWLSSLDIERTTILFGACTTTLLIAIGTGLCTYWYTKIMGDVAQKVVYELRGRLFAHMQRLSLRFHDKQHTGDLVARLTSDVQSIQEVLGNFAIIFLSNSFLLFNMLVMMFWLNWQFALIALSVAPFLFWSVFRNTRELRNASKRARTSAGRMASLAQETLASIRIVQGLAQEEQQDGRFETQSAASLDAYRDAVRHQATVAPIVDVLAAAGLCLVMWFGATQVMAGALTTGDVVIFFAYVTNLYSPMRALSKSANSCAKALVGAERIAEIFQTQSDVSDAAGSLPIEITTGKIEFRNISFNYAEGRHALSGVSLVIDPGETIAIVGATGAGKSTLIGLVPRLYDPSRGAVLIDDQDIRDYSIRSLRQQISIVLQDSLLFSGSISENISFGRPTATAEEIEEAARIANADEFIERLPDGYETAIAEGGVTLSGGQRQRVAIARAALRDSPILILDEPTSGLDAVSERAVIEALKSAAVGRTTLIVAHRLATVRFADRIVVMDRGTIAEVGTHQQLLNRRGLYARLYELQSLKQSEQRTALQA